MGHSFADSPLLSEPGDNASMFMLVQIFPQKASVLYAQTSSSSIGGPGSVVSFKVICRVLSRS